MPAKPQPLAKPEPAPAAKKSVRVNAWNKPLHDPKGAPQKPPPGIPTEVALPGGDVGSQVLRDRLLHLTLSLVGSPAVVTMMDGTVIEGIFHNFTPFDGLAPAIKNKFVIKASKVVGQKNGDGAEFQDGGTLIISASKVACVHSKRVEWESLSRSGTSDSSNRGATKDFNTDVEISGRSTARSRGLVAAGSAWTSGTSSLTELALDGSNSRAKKLNLQQGGNIGQWDQFKANEQLFNVSASFDENLYTTQLDKSTIDLGKKAEAERIAKEIEGSTSSNIHVAEERGQKLGTDFDEEDRYSGVLTHSGKVRHEETGGKNSSKKPGTMNYAAAAAKADPDADAQIPPGFSSKKSQPVDSSEPPTRKTNEESRQKLPADAKRIAQTKTSIQIGSEESTAKEAEQKKSDRNQTTTKQAEQRAKGRAEKNEQQRANDGSEGEKGTKLNANAKKFTFNPSAKSFTPGFAPPVAQPSTGMQEHQQIVPDANTHMMHPPNAMHGSHYMQPPVMNQPGMMNVMNAPYNANRYQSVPYGNMDQQHPHQIQFLPTNPDGVTNDGEAKGGEESSKEDRKGPQQGGAPVHLPQQHGAMQQYGMAPQVYYGGGMGVHPHNPSYAGQFVRAPHMAVGPANAPYGHMYPMPGGVAPSMHVGGANAGPYGASPMPYPNGSYASHGGGIEDVDMGGRGRSGGQGRGGRGKRSGRGGGRGRGSGRGNGFHNYNSQGGRSNGQEQEHRDSARSSEH